MGIFRSLRERKKNSGFLRQVLSPLFRRVADLARSRAPVPITRAGLNERLLPRLEMQTSLRQVISKVLPYTFHTCMLLARSFF